VWRYPLAAGRALVNLPGEQDMRLIQNLSFDRIVFALAVLTGTLLIWSFSYPALLDLPQHAGQIDSLYRLLTQTHSHAAELQINLLSPFLLVYAAGTALAFIFPISIVLKLLITLIFWGFLWSGVRLLRHFGSPAQLGWLFIPAFFGMCWLSGFINYMAAACLLFLFIIALDRQAHSSSISRGLEITLLSLLLVITHGLMFYFSLFYAAIYILLQYRLNLYAAIKAALPLAPAVALSLLQFLALQDSSALTLSESKQSHFEWSFDIWRLLFFQTSSYSIYCFLFIAALLLAPFVFAQFKVRGRQAFIPLMALGLAAILFPNKALYIIMIVDRLSLLVMPFWALLFIPLAQQRPAKSLYATLILAGATFGLLAFEAVRQQDFKTESRPLLNLYRNLPEGQRLLTLSSLPRTSGVYKNRFRHFSLWYQIEQNGWSEFNFAAFNTMVVRYRTNPPINTTQISTQEKLNWQTYQASKFDYILIWHEIPLSADFFSEAPCGVALAETGTNWSLFRVVKCAAEPPKN
jgi:hypothetical protein